ncbi:Fic family protein [Pontibacter sp. G13]|uniref:Fic family protein n=1 Tax=Pontibacter sp. G13 TaxID=3074898 RepID=UPI00288B2241|nr:Fic family protein [Pontibacter sp. G13]WNJ20496.1 Fic family protein [Pontibacter sp. G13]
MDQFISGQQIHQGYYQSFQPCMIHRKWNITDMELLSLLGKADRQLGKLDMFSSFVPNIELFISMHVLKEATQSSKIEGTKTNIEDLLMDQPDVDVEKRDDWEEVQNYIKALHHGLNRLSDLPLSARLMRETHQILLQGVRGTNKLPGEFRNSQNWIGGASINDATFVPPHHSTIGDYMSDLERFIHDEQNFFPELLKIALIHYQFETIHPFLDGNGRLGRLFIVMYLVDKGLLQRPILYLSDFFERNKGLYYDNLMRVRTHSDIRQWFKFFLVGVIETASFASQTFEEILQLKQQSEKDIQVLGNRIPSALKVLEHLFKRPLVNASMVQSITGLSSPSAYRLLNDLEKLGILEEVSGRKRKRVYIFRSYLSLFESPQP